jgi:hypothetical protein
MALTTDGSQFFYDGSGTVEVELASSPKHDISVTSGSGDAIVNFNGNEIKGEIVMKASKKHGNIEAPFAFDKTEEIQHSWQRCDHPKNCGERKLDTRISISTGSGDAVLKK